MAVPYFQDNHKDHKAFLAGLFLLTGIMLFPAVLPARAGWLTSIIPLPIFYYSVLFGRKEGISLVRNAVLLAAVLALLIGSLPVLVFSLAMVLLGLVFSHGVFNRKNPVETGIAGALFLAMAWGLFWTLLGMIYDTNPYSTLVAELDQGLDNGLQIYEKTSGIAPETLESVRAGVQFLRKYLPSFLPSLLVSGVLTVTWLNLVLGNWLLKRKNRELTPWPDYSEWQLPESFVWVVIVSGITAVLMPGQLRTVGINFLIICATVYFFQGLAILASWLNRWSVPMFIRWLIYALIFIQTYGIIILSFLGLADVWADFRKLNKPAENTDTAG